MGFNSKQMKTSSRKKKKQQLQDDQLLHRTASHYFDLADKTKVMFLLRMSLW